MIKISTMSMKDLMNFIQQNQQLPSVFNHEYIMFFNLNLTKEKLHVYNKSFSVAILHQAIYTGKNKELVGVFITSQVNVKKHLDIQDKIQLSDTMDFVIYDGVFKIGGEIYRKNLVLYMLQNAQLLGFVTEKNYIRYIFGIIHNKENKIMIIGNEQCQIFKTNEELLDGIKPNITIELEEMAQNSIYFKEINENTIDFFIINFTPHKITDHHEKHTIRIVRVCKNQIISVQNLHDDCDIKNKDKKANNNYEL